jgi:hypothetical protein
MNALINEPSWMIIVMETTCILLLACGGMLFLMLRQNRRDKANVRSFVAAAHNDLKSREQSLLEVCSQRFRMSTEQIGNSVEELVGMERDIYKMLVVAYHDRDGVSLLKVHSNVKRLLWACLDLAPPTHEYGTPEGIQKYESMVQQLEESEQHNRRLHEQISRNQEEMTHLLAEYQRIFKKNQAQEAEATPATA